MGVICGGLLMQLRMSRPAQVHARADAAGMLARVQVQVRATEPGPQQRRAAQHQQQGVEDRGAKHAASVGPAPEGVPQVIQVQVVPEWSAA